MMRTIALLCLLGLSLASRNQLTLHGVLEEEGADAADEGEKYCCCKYTACNPEEKTGVFHGIYSPNVNACCKKSTWSCMHPFSNWGYNKALDMKYCEAPQISSFVGALPPVGETVKEPDMTVGSPAHTVHTYCTDPNEEIGAPDEADAKAGTVEFDPQAIARKEAAVKELVHELSANSLDTMAKEIFSIYVCVRWAPDPEFVAMVEDEKLTDQLPDEDSFKLYKDSRFIPLRCSRNVPVYSMDQKLGENFDFFEQSVLAIADWLKAEDHAAFQMRLNKIQQMGPQSAKKEARAFDLAEVARVVAQCKEEGKLGGKIGVPTDVPADEFLKDCNAAKWWLQKLQDWHTAVPFRSFMAPDEEAASVAAPKTDEHVLVCFGKRVASQLHRRQGGRHLLTDQSAVGCHGYWGLSETADMLRKTVQIWRPPTCQLQALEIDMKIKIMEVIADMNKRLFNSLPALLMEQEEGDMTSMDADAPLQIRNTAMRAMSSIFSLFKSKQSKYASLGKMLGNTVVKWAVCKTKPLSTVDEEEQLDSVLGTEDDLARWYAQAAYAEFSGKKVALPGEVCEAADPQKKMPTCQVCHLGQMGQNKPEAYKDEEFVCPERPLLKGKMQFDVLQKHEGMCISHMITAQYPKEWTYRGNQPQMKQYNITENVPLQGHQLIKIMSFSRAQDNKYYLVRDWVQYGKGCTHEESLQTPRWCSAPVLLKSKLSMVMDVVRQGVAAAISTGQGAAEAAGAAANVVQAMRGKKDVAPPMNKAFKKRTLQWIEGEYHASKRGLTDLFNRYSDRYDRLFKKSFETVEADELLHSASYQDLMAETNADSKGYKHFNRYAVLCPCAAFDPKREFELKFKNSERALALAKDAISKFKALKVFEAAVPIVEILGTATLHMTAVEEATTKTKAWITTYAEPAEGESPITEWQQTKNSLVMYLAGAISTRSSTKLTAAALSSYKVTFKCGDRRALHNTGNKDPKASIPANFKECVKAGVAYNSKLRKANPTRLYFPKEIVVVATASTADRKCYGEIFSKNKPADDAAAAEAKFKEEDNKVYKAFQASLTLDNCDTPDSATDLPKGWTETRKKDATYRGTMTGFGVPKDNVVEAVLDPQDFIEVLGKVW